LYAKAQTKAIHTFNTCNPTQLILVIDITITQPNYNDYLNEMKFCTI